MGAGQRPAADAGIQDQFAGRQALHLHRALHVSQLTPVEIAAAWATEPAEKDVARGLHQPLARDDTVSMVPVGALREERFEHRSLCLLDLEEQRIIFVATFEQHDVVSSADATYPYDLSRHVHETVLVEQVTPVVLQATPVDLQDVVDLFPQLLLHDANQERWIIDDDPLTIDNPGQLGPSLQTVAATCLYHGLFRPLHGLR